MPTLSGSILPPERYAQRGVCILKYSFIKGHARSGGSVCGAQKSRMFGATLGPMAILYVELEQVRASVGFWVVPSLHQ